jgi:hypothetical protein
VRRSWRASRLRSRSPKLSAHYARTLLLVELAAVAAVAVTFVLIASSL